jgi:hypothetical protein
VGAERHFFNRTIEACGIIVKERKEKRDPEDRDGNLPDLARPKQGR